MARLLVVHPARSALEHEALGRVLAAAGEEHELVLACGEPALAWVERELQRADALVLVEPARWWPRSHEERLRRPWLAWIERHVEFDRRNSLRGVASLARVVPRSEALARVHWLGSAGLAGVTAWLAGRDGGPPARALEFGEVDESIDRPKLGEALETALSRARAVALVGAAGSGKTALLRRWVARARLEGRRVAEHFVLPEHGATRRSAWILASLARKLDPSATSLADALARAERGPGRGSIVLVVDGLERVDDVAGLLDALPAGAQARWLLGCRPGARPDTASVVSIEPDDALLDTLVAGVGRIGPVDREALRVRAGGSPGYLAAMLDEAASRTPSAELREMTKPAEGDALPRLPRRFEAELACMLGHVVALPLALRRKVERLLEVLALFGGKAPLSAVQAALELGSLPELLVAAAGALVLVPGRAPELALVHAGLTELVLAQLDDRAALEHRVRRSFERLGRDALDAEGRAFVATWLAKPRTGGALVDVAQLQAELGRGGVVALERALARHGEDTEADLRAVVRRHQAALTREPATLSTLLWNGLVQRGWAQHQLLTALRWPDEGPRVRLERALEHADHRWRTLPHPAEACGCAIDSSGTRVLTACDDGILRLWSREQGTLLAELDCGRMIRACVISPDGRWAVAATISGKLLRFDLVEKTCTHTVTVREAWVRALAIDAGANVVLSGDDEGYVSLWRVGEKPRELGRQDERVVSVALDPQARVGVSAGGKRVQTWDLDAGKLLGTSAKHEYSIHAMAIDRSGKRAYACGIGATWLVALPSCKLETTLEHKLPLANACVALETQDVVVIAHAGRLERWNLRSGELEARWWVNVGDVADLAVAGQRWWVSAGGSDVVVSTSPEATADTVAGARGRTCVAANPSGTHALVAAGSKLQLVCLWEKPAGFSPLVDGVHEGPPTSLPADTSAVARQVVHELDTGLVNALAWLDDDRVLTAGATSHELAIWSVGQRRVLSKRELGKDWLRGVAISPDRKRALVVGDERHTWVVDLADLSERSLGRSSDWAHACSFARGGALAVSVDGDAELRIWTLDDDTRPRMVKSEKNHAHAALVCTSSHAFAGGSSGVIDVWTLDDGHLAAAFEAHRGKVTALALDAEQRVLVSAGVDARVALWRLGGTPQLLDCVNGHAPFNGLCVSGSRILATDEAGNLWTLHVDWRRLAGVAG